MKHIIENKIVGILDGENNLEFVENDEDMKNLWEDSLIDKSGKFGFIDDLVLFVGDSKDEVRKNLVEFMKKELEENLNFGE